MLPWSCDAEARSGLLSRSSNADARSVLLPRSCHCDRTGRCAGTGPSGRESGACAGPSPGFTGSAVPEDALRALLSGTGLRYDLSAPGTVTMWHFPGCWLLVQLFGSKDHQAQSILGAKWVVDHDSDIHLTTELQHQAANCSCWNPLSAHKPW